MGVSRFGHLADGTAIERISLGDGRLSLHLLTLGATIQDLAFHARGGWQRCVLGFPRFSDYLNDAAYCGRVVGRFANRIAGGSCEIAGRTYRLTRNEGGHTHLHGGATGFSGRAWSLVDHGTTHATLELLSPDGEEGYPGSLTARCTYRLTGDGEVTIELTATTDRATIVNLATHSYFNLDLDLDAGADADAGDIAGNILDHVLEMPAAYYLPVDAHRVPGGEIASVADTPFDFRRARRVRIPGASPFLYDHNFVLARARSLEPRFAAALTGPLSGTRLEIHTTEPGLQFYDGVGMGPPVQGHDGRRYGAHAGLCLEPQNFPDAPNHAHFPDAVLAPGDTYRQVTLYRFSSA